MFPAVVPVDFTFCTRMGSTSPAGTLANMTSWLTASL